MKLSNITVVATGLAESSINAVAPITTSHTTLVTKVALADDGKPSIWTESVIVVEPILGTTTITSTEAATTSDNPTELDIPFRTNTINHHIHRGRPWKTRPPHVVRGNGDDEQAKDEPDDKGGESDSSSGSSSGSSSDEEEDDKGGKVDKRNAGAVLKRRGGYKGYSDLKGKEKEEAYAYLLDGWKKINPKINIYYDASNSDGPPTVGRAGAPDYAYDIQVNKGETLFVEELPEPGIDDPRWNAQMPTEKEWKKMKKENGGGN